VKERRVVCDSCKTLSPIPAYVVAHKFGTYCLQCWKITQNDYLEWLNDEENLKLPIIEEKCSSCKTFSPFPAYVVAHEFGTFCMQCWKIAGEKAYYGWLAGISPNVTLSDVTLSEVRLSKELDIKGLIDWLNEDGLALNLCKIAFWEIGDGYDYWNECWEECCRRIALNPSSEEAMSFYASYVDQKTAINGEKASRQLLMAFIIAQVAEPLGVELNIISSLRDPFIGATISRSTILQSQFRPNPN
jgi:hypothetical protein